jgi:hypothetical protein
MNYIVISDPKGYKSTEYEFALFSAEEIIYSDTSCSALNIDVVDCTDDAAEYWLPDTKEEINKKIFSFSDMYTFEDSNGVWHYGVHVLGEYDNEEDAIEAYNAFIKDFKGNKDKLFKED